MKILRFSHVQYCCSKALKFLSDSTWGGKERKLVRRTKNHFVSGFTTNLCYFFLFLSTVDNVHHIYEFMKYVPSPLIKGEFKFCLDQTFCESLENYSEEKNEMKFLRLQKSQSCLVLQMNA